MKLFGNSPKIIDYLKQPLTNNDIELELIFGYSPNRNPIDKKIFLKLLDTCNGAYQKLFDTVSLDIRTEYKGNPSNVRATIHGLDSIKQYCKNGHFNDIETIDFIYKKNNKEYKTIRDNNYNVRLNVKTEERLRDQHYFVRSFKEDYENKKKHYRYKKRFSYITNDKLFRIDLTIVKATNYSYGKYDFQKSFKKADILKNKEIYELEIEYIGWSKDIGIQEIDNLFKQHYEKLDTLGPGIKENGNIYDPLNLGIQFIEEEIPELNIVKEYDPNSPRYDKSENPTLLMGYMESSTRYSQEDYEKMIGKSVLIKKEYFEESDISINIYNTMIQYYKLGRNHGIIVDVYEELEENIGGKGKYIDSKALISFSPPLGNISSLIVPLKYIYGDLFTIEELMINEGYNVIPSNDLQLFDPKEDKHIISSESSIDNTPSWAPKKVGKKKDTPKEDDVDSLLQKISKELFKKLEEHVIYLSKAIYDTDQLISYQVKEDVIKQYKQLTGQKSKYFNFIGPQPVTLTKDSLKISHPNSITMDYAVTEKADGERYELFIFKNIGYLINSKQEVIDTGCNFPNIQGKWILDGEYITKNKYNEPMNLFMIFDVYWCDIKGSGIPIEAHSLPFLSRNDLDIRSRKYILDQFQQLIKGSDSIIQYRGDHSIEIQIKEYSLGYQSKNIEESINNSSLELNNSIEIFKASKNILKKDKEGNYPYRIDGLIYLPTRLSVKGTKENVLSNKISGTWYNNYKWKPPEENTIDFLVKIRSDLNKGELQDIIQPYIQNINGSKILKESKIIDLFVGYKEIDDDNINYCMKILLNKTHNSDTIQKFNINSEDENKYNTTNIPLEKGSLYCLNYEKDQINDGDIVEFRYNNEAENGMFWEPLRVRSDKIKPQYFTSANKIWDTILNPITEDMITGTDIISGEYSIIDQGIYYKDRENDLLIDSLPLRRFHNYIKSRLISGVCSTFNKKIKIMDLSCGRGGDIHKYLETNNVSVLLGIDISTNIQEACKRFYTTKSNNCKPVFLRGDTSRNIKNNNYSSIDGGSKDDKDHTQIMTNILYGNDSPIPKKYLPIRDKYLGIANSGFDIISSQFSLHYYFESEDKLNNLILNIKENIKKGGYFIGTCYDGEKIFNRFKNKKDAYDKYNIDNITESEEDTIESEDDDSTTSSTLEYISKEYNELDYNEISHKDIKGNYVFKIVKKYDMDNFEDNIFGNIIDVYMDSIGQTIPEYLVNFKYFIKRMEENGLKPVIPKGINRKYISIFRNDHFNSDNIGEFSSIINKIPEINKTDTDFKNKYNEANNLIFNQGLMGSDKIVGDYISNPIQYISSLNNYFIFQKL